ncbi:type II toxin-antitoxin system RelE/ParE family toxin [Azospirillum sp. INR13]|nr:type II toxin-antitoxin system RelE/ParE family toxin [Azospirillum sp. INR13]
MIRPLPLRLTEAAEADLAELWAHVAAESSKTVATGFIRAIEATLQPLCRFPLSGAARDELAAGLRVTFHRAYAIYGHSCVESYSHKGWCRRQVPQVACASQG